MFWITFTSGEQKGQRRRIQRRNVVIGRDLSCQVWLADDTAAPRHAEIAETGGIATARALESTVPLLVNGIEVTEARLADGDILQIGRTSMRFQMRRNAMLDALPRVAGFVVLIGGMIGGGIWLWYRYAESIGLTTAPQTASRIGGGRQTSAPGAPLVAADTNLVRMEKISERLDGTNSVAPVPLPKRRGYALPPRPPRPGVPEAPTAAQDTGSTVVTTTPAPAVTPPPPVATPPAVVSTASPPTPPAVVTVATSAPAPTAATPAPTAPPAVTENVEPAATPAPRAASPAPPTPAAPVAIAVAPAVAPAPAPAPATTMAPPMPAAATAAVVVATAPVPPVDPAVEARRQIRAKSEAALKIAEILISHGETARAGEYLNAIEAADPAYLPALAERARLEEKNGHLDLAEKAWTRVLQRSLGDPLYETACTELARLAERQIAAAPPALADLRMLMGAGTGGALTNPGAPVFPAPTSLATSSAPGVTVATVPPTPATIAHSPAPTPTVLHPATPAPAITTPASTTPVPVPAPAAPVVAASGRPSIIDHAAPTNSVSAPAPAPVAPVPVAHPPVAAPRVVPAPVPAVLAPATPIVVAGPLATTPRVEPAPAPYREPPPPAPAPVTVAAVTPRVPSLPVTPAATPRPVDAATAPTPKPVPVRMPEPSHKPLPLPSLKIAQVDVRRFPASHEYDDFRMVRVDVRATESTTDFRQELVTLEVQFFDQSVRSGAVFPSRATSQAQPLAASKASWRPGESRSLSATYLVPSGTRHKEEYTREGPGRYYGYRAKLFYDGKLLDQIVKPETLPH